jgi:transketolase
VSLGWKTYIGAGASVIGVDQFGASAPGGRVMAEYGFNVENVVKRALDLLDTKK